MPQSPPESGPEPAPAPDDPYAALRLRGYRLYLASSTCGVIGSQVQAVAVSWEIYNRTNDAMSLAYIGLARALPFFLFGLVTGQLADWFNRKTLLLSSQFTSMLCACGIAAASFYNAPVWIFYCILFLRASAGTLGMPARQAMLPQVVPMSVFQNAITWNSGIFHMALVLGPALGGIISDHGTFYAYLVDVFGMLLAMALLLMVPVRKADLRREPLSLAGLLAGAAFVWKTKVILATITLDLFAVLLGGATALLPIYARDILDSGARGLGWLRAAPAVGSCAMALALVYLPPMKKAGRMLLWMVAGFGAATIGFGLSTSFEAALAALFLTGVFDQVSVVVRHTLVQTLAPDHLRGRISAINSIFIGASNQLGEMESGFVAAVASPVFSVVSGGVGTILVVLGVMAKWPQVAAIGRLEDVKPPEEAPPPDAVANPPAAVEA